MFAVLTGGLAIHTVKSIFTRKGRYFCVNVVTKC